MTPALALINGKADPCISPLDRAVMYGDGVFRTLKVLSGKPLAWDIHYRKLASDCAALFLPCPPEAELFNDIQCLFAAHGDGVIKLVISRGVGQRGYAQPDPLIPTRMAIHSPLPIYPADYAVNGVKARVCDLRLSAQPRLAGIKHLNRLENVLARLEWGDPDIAEGLLLDASGSVVEGTMSNLFAYAGGELFTPDLSCCGVAGVQRERIMFLAEILGIKLVVGSLKVESLLAAQELFLCNSVIDIWPIRQLQEKIWAPGHLTHQLREMLRKLDD